ncbi:MAG: FGGY family carbohydrate kinase [Candidatus Heimdallarchaeota archaeon]
MTDFTNASRTMLFDINTLSWSDYILNKLDIPIEKLPRPMQSGTKIGGLTKKA